MQKFLDEKLEDISLLGYGLTLSFISISVILLLTNLSAFLL
jgi:hypothetical protein